MVIPLLANQDLTPMLFGTRLLINWFLIKNVWFGVAVQGIKLFFSEQF